MKIVIEMFGSRYEFDGQEWSGGIPDQPSTIYIKEYLTGISGTIGGGAQPAPAEFAQAVQRLEQEVGVTVLEATPPAAPDPQEFRDDVIY